MTARVSRRSVIGCRRATASRVSATRSNSALTSGLIFSAHSIWLWYQATAPRELCSLLSACEDYALLDVTAMSRYAQVRNAEHRVRRDGIDLQTVAFVQPHLGGDTVHG